MKSVVDKSMTQKKELKGIGGWLGLRLWSDVLLNPIAIFIHLGTFLYPKVFSYGIISGYKILPLYYSLPLLTFTIAELFLSCFAISLKPWAIKFYKYFYKVQLTFYISMSVLCLIYIAGGLHLVIGIDKPLRAAVGSIIWLTYFNKSKRVKNTFFAGANS